MQSLIPCRLALTHTFMQVPAERVLVVYDDLDLPTAAVRLRAKGGPGGHNGMKSISGGWMGGGAGGQVSWRLQASVGQ